jgi:hypothetical protein
VLKLPKDLVADPRHDVVSSLLTANAGLLWEGSRNPVATLPMTAALVAELRGALAIGLAFQGLELITEKLASEQKGLDALKQEAPYSPQNARASRLLFVADDGSTRFYRDVDTLLTRYQRRLIACRLEVPGETLGEALLGGAKLVRSVLLVDKRVVARALLALLPPG